MIFAGQVLINNCDIVLVKASSWLGKRGFTRRWPWWRES